MTLALQELRVLYHRGPGDSLRVGRLAYKNGRAAFEYDSLFREEGLELSPFGLPLREGLSVADSSVFEGLFGLFDDSLPDGWGRLLLDRFVETRGGQRHQLTPLDRLAWVSSRALGALSYEPEHEIEDPKVLDLHALSEQAQLVLEDRTSEALETLLMVGGSPQGARPKALVLLDADSENVIAGAEHRDGFEAFLVKFSAPSDPRDSAGCIEYAYSLMARAAGLTMPETRLVGPRGNHHGHFAIKRFDRCGAQRLHTHTVSGLIDAPPGQAFISYEDVLNLTSQLTRNVQDVEQMLRRAAFNVYSHNRDDHSRNTAFRMEPDGTWKLAPAYDLTFSSGPGGEHTMLVAGEGRTPTKEHILSLAQNSGIRRSVAELIVAEVQESCMGWEGFAEEAGVPETDAKRIAQALTQVSAP